MQGPGSRASRVCVPKPELGNEGVIQEKLLKRGMKSGLQRNHSLSIGLRVRQTSDFIDEALLDAVKLKFADEGLRFRIFMLKDR